MHHWVGIHYEVHFIINLWTLNNNQSIILFANHRQIVITLYVFIQIRVSSILFYF